MQAPNNIFFSTLNINYDKQFIPSVQSFLHELMTLSGANNSETMQMKVAIEEVMAFIIDNYPDDRVNNSINIRADLLDDNHFVVEVTNIGPPVYEDKIPHFNFDEEDSVAGLWYQMTKTMVDDLQFINNKNDGWLIRLFKKLKQVTFEHETVVSSSQEISSNLSVRKAVPADAGQLTDLAYNTYRYTYGVSDYYDIKMLGKLIEEGKYVVFVVENDQRIIGAVSIKIHGSTGKSAELGAAMITPEYRRSTALLRLIKEVDAYHRLNPLTLEYFESVPVTTHTISQRSLSKVGSGYKPFAILLNITPGPNFIAINDRLGQRESLLLSYLLCDKLQCNKLYVPAGHQLNVSEIIQNTSNDISVLSDTCNVFTGDSDISVHFNEASKEATIKVNSLGEKWFSEIRSAMFKLQMKKPDAVNLRVTTRKPFPQNFDEQLNNMGLLFNGLVLFSLSEIYLSYIQIIQPVNFDAIQLNDPVAINLLSHIKQQYDCLM
jgi:anti-sigma regulatory factor (Ser/Thr protein kinase)